MLRLASCAATAAVFLAAASSLPANSVVPLSASERVGRAAVICRATVLASVSLRPAGGGIHTRTTFRVEEALKGRFPEVLAVTHRGGVLPDGGESFSDRPNFRPGTEHVLLLGRRADGTLFADDGAVGAPVLRAAGLHKTAGGAMSPVGALLMAAARGRYPDASAAGADVRDQAGPTLGERASPGLSADGSGISRRFTAGDRGEPIEYLVDADFLPAGISQAQALGAVSNAFQAWANVSSAKFVFGGVVSFGAAAPNVVVNDGRIRVQLHDQYNHISGSTTLGVGGNSWTVSSTFPNGGMGGSVAGEEFFPVSRGYLVMKHTRTTLQNLSSLEESLCHEIGHVLSLAHSSESTFEPNTTLREAVMFFQIHQDGRGATLGAYDPPVVRQAYPTNTPPFGYNRVLDIVTASTLPVLPGFNEVGMRGLDLQTTNLTAELVSATTNNGTFSLNSGVLRFTPRLFFSDGVRFDPAGSSAYDRAFVRLSDGTNASPFVETRVISFSSDTFPSGSSDGIPDNWMTTHFGNANPTAGPLRNATDDFDGDGVSNLDEHRTGTIPTNAASVLRFTGVSTSTMQWLARPYELYEVQSATQLTNWTRFANPVVATNTNGVLGNLSAPTGSRIFRVLRLP